MLQRVGSLIPEKVRPAISRPISSCTDIDLKDPVIANAQCECKKKKEKLVLSEFRIGTSTLGFSIQGQIAATVTLGLATHTYVALLFECLKCGGERRVLCDFGPDSEDKSVGVSNWDLAEIENALSETIEEGLKGLMYDDVYAAFKATERKFPVYNIISSNCKHWATEFRVQVQALLL